MKTTDAMYRAGRAAQERHEISDRNERWGFTAWTRYVVRVEDGRHHLLCGHSVPEDRPFRSGEGPNEVGEIRRICFACRRTLRDRPIPALFQPKAKELPRPVRPPKRKLHFRDQGGAIVCTARRAKDAATDPAAVTCGGCVKVLERWGRR